jgi:hypothetical protein
MTAWLKPLRRVLDTCERPVEFFFRDDDAGWADSRLLELLDLFDCYQVPLDLAVIPCVLSEELACELNARSAVSRIRIHQHGFAHTNHEVIGRKCEFGVSRSKSEQLEDIRQGKIKLEEMLDGTVDSIFTPPWNRCTRTTAECLVQLGFSALSRDATAETLSNACVAELPIQVDWFSKHKATRLTLEQLGEKFARSIDTNYRIGVMLHHQLMDHEERELLEQLLAFVGEHPQVRCLHMQQVIVNREISRSRSSQPALWTEGL